ncbi:hypothetical protein CDN98_03715 [Roseateles terrae]|nr:hypothetical protein CDN98_03715 [Roseateles terrae]
MDLLRARTFGVALGLDKVTVVAASSNGVAGGGLSDVKEHLMMRTCPDRGDASAGGASRHEYKGAVRNRACPVVS